MAVIRDIESVDNPLHKLMLQAVPENELGNKTITHLAGLIGVTPYSCWLWIGAKHLSAARALSIVEVSEGRVTIEDFLPYILNVPKRG